MADIVRQAINELSVHELIATEAIVDTVVNYFNRRDDIEQVRSAIKTRYGYGIVSVKDPNNDKAPPVETYAKENFHEQVDAGMVDSLSVGFGQRMTNALATLFTEKGAKFTLVHNESTKENQRDVQAADDLLNYYREEGGFNSSLVKADQKSVQIGSSAVFPRFSRDTMSYDVLAPSDIRAFWAKTITEEGKVRSTDSTDIEDASVVIIRLSQVDVATWRYLAIYGESKEYEFGRYVEYEASNESTDVPELGAKGAIEYEIDGIYCNPLTYWAKQPENKDLDLPEYPIAIIDGGTTEGGFMPTTTSLYENCLKLDEKASHTVSTVDDAAVGLTVVTRGHEGKTATLPRSLSGKVALDVGLDVEHISKDSQASVDAWSIKEKAAVEIAGSYGVPAYMVVEEDSAFVQAESGIALQVKTQQLRKSRDRRYNDNRPGVKKIFQIETAYLGLFSERDDAAAKLLQECTQTWDAGELKLPQNQKESVDRIKTLGEIGVMDTIAQIKDYYQFATDSEAIDFYEKMKERKTKYPPLVEEKKPPPGLPRRGQGQPPGQLKAVK